MDKFLNSLEQPRNDGPKNLPEKWADRTFRDPINNYVLRNRGDFQNLPIDSIFEGHVDNTLAEHIEEIQNEAISFEDEYGPEFLEKMNKTYNWVAEYFQGMGFDVENLPLAYLLPVSDTSQQAYSSPALIAIHNNFERVEDKNFREIETLRILGHELYHATGKRVMDFIKDSEGSIDADPDTVYGASYNVGKDGGGALEEGLAYTFQKEVIEKNIRTLFPSDVMNRYDKVIAEALADPVAQEHNLSLVFITGYDGAHTSWTGDPYNDASIKMVGYLSSTVPDFQNLVENARVERHTLPLARAIEKEFGEGSYRLITSAVTTEAEGVFEELKRRKEAGSV